MEIGSVPEAMKFSIPPYLGMKGEENKFLFPRTDPPSHFLAKDARAFLDLRTDPIPGAF